MPATANEAPAPAVSVCVPSYQGAAHIAATIESVLAQTFSDFELLIVDDDSRDQTPAVVARYPDPRIRFLRNERNLGPEGNWNRCLELARGRYFKLLPQDDLLGPDCLARQVGALEAHQSDRLALVFCARTIIDGNSRALMRRGYRGRRGGVVSGRSVIRSCLRRGTNLIGEPASVLFPKDLARRVGGFDASIGYVVDLDYWFRLLLQGDAYYLPESLASFRVSSGSWSVAIGMRQSEEFQKFIARVAANPAFGVTRADILTGRLMAWLNSLLRMLVYRLVLDRRSVQ
jgi:glycosyltransferase involved in cell wall biosynthesis